MALNGKLTSGFLEGIKEAENVLLALNFRQYAFEKKGYAYFIDYIKEDTIVKFLFGPPEWEVEMIIFTAKAKFSYSDLLQIQAISKWVSDNKYKTSGNERSTRDELFWFIELLKFSLPIIE